MAIAFVEQLELRVLSLSISIETALVLMPQWEPIPASRLWHTGSGTGSLERRSRYLMMSPTWRTRALPATVMYAALHSRTFVRRDTSYEASWGHGVEYLVS